MQRSSVRSCTAMFELCSRTVTKAVPYVYSVKINKDDLTIYEEEEHEVSNT